MTGNEAIARGAYEAGIRFAAAYPGTPSSEILENAARYEDGIHAEWAPNEKVAMESAFGFSVLGGRSMVSMKQVGLNVASDPMFSMAYTGVNGALVIISADEPGIHSSQTEQDNRYYAKMAKIPMLEPADSQECRDMVIEAVRISEKYKSPVLIRMTTRICHSKGVVELGERKEAPAREYHRDIWQFTTMPAVSKKLRVEIEEKVAKYRQESEASPMNRIEDNGSRIGIIANGISRLYARDAFGKDASYLDIGFSNPLPLEKIRSFTEGKEKIYVIEETEPFMEEQVKALGIDCTGRDKLTGCGELSTRLLKKELLGEEETLIETDPDELVGRPPALCAGCSHRPVFYDLGKRKDIVVSGDIGCYGLGAMPPLNGVDTILCMGNSVSAGHGMAKAAEIYGTDKKVVSVIGDSTFFHSGMTGLLDVVYNGSDTVTIILDNRTTGMTGHQDHPGTGYTAQGEFTKEADLEAIVRALGVTHVWSLDPLNMKLFHETLDEALALDEPSVIICRRPCSLKKLSGRDLEEFGREKDRCSVDPEKCIGCKVCLGCGCPALRFDQENGRAEIDPLSCNGCEVCAQICPVSAISKETKEGRA